MERLTDWIKLWRELVDAQARYRARKHSRRKQADHWAKRARRFDTRVKKRWEKKDPHRNFILSRLSTAPDATVLDIGAGTGAWALLMAPHVRKVTALEPSAEMRAVMLENIEREGIDNIVVLDAHWPLWDMERHDFALCSHAMYGASNLPEFVRAMGNATKRSCFLLLRAPDWDGVLAQAAIRIWGQPNDSPNFQVALGALFQIGIQPNVLMEQPGLWPPWTHGSIEEALHELLLRFDVPEASREAEDLKALLEDRLTRCGDRYVWPVGVRTALIYWDI